jgi:hypothetical protein
MPKSTNTYPYTQTKLAIQPDIKVITFGIFHTLQTVRMPKGLMADNHTNSQRHIDEMTVDH